MTQEIKIGVSGDASGGEKIVQKLDQATGQLAGELNRVDAAAGKVNQRLETMGQMAQRIQSVQNLLSRDIGRPVAREDAETFIGNFDRMRKGRGVASRRLRAFDDFEQWYFGHNASFPKAADAEKHRRFVIAAGMQGTQDSYRNGAPPEPPAPGDGGGERERGGMARRAGSMAWGFVKGGLALAGIGSLMGMAGKGVSDAQTEAVGIDTLKRRLGDLGVDFDHLREQARGAAFGLGLTYVESQKLAQQYTREAGALSDAEIRGVGLRNEVRTGVGMSRAYGLDPEQGVQFFGSMRRLGVVSDDRSAEKLALLIADAVSKGGYGGKADEVLSAISNYAAQTARIALSMPNVLAYANALTSLTGTGIKGLDPQGAASLIGQADSAVRGGGAFGMASQNFSYMALARGIPGIDPVTASGVLAGGLFGTTRQQFGPDSALGQYYAAHHLRAPAGSDITNADRIIPLLMKLYGPKFGLDATKNFFGLQSVDQAAALSLMRDKGVLGASGKLLDRAKIDVSKLSATGLASIGDIANASNVDQLNKVYGGLLGRKDLTEGERKSLADAQAGGNLEAMKEVAARVMASKEQAQTEGSQTRESIANVEKAINLAAAELLKPLNIVRNAVSALATHFAAGEMKRADILAKEHPDYAAAMATFGADKAKWLQKNFEEDDADLLERLKKTGPHGVDIDKLFPHSDRSDFVGLMANAERDNAAKVVGSAREREVETVKFFRDRGYSADDAAAITGRLMSESGLLPGKFNGAGGGMGAFGIAQWRGKRLKDLMAFAKARHEDPANLDVQRRFVDFEFKGPESAAFKAMRQAKTLGEKYRALAAYERNEKPSSWKEGYAAAIAALPEKLFGGPAAAKPAHPPPHVTAKTPAAHAKVSADAGVHHHVEGTVTIVDEKGRPKAKAQLKHVRPPVPAGVG